MFSEQESLMSNPNASPPSQRDLVLASLRRGTGRDNCAGAKNGQGAVGAAKPPKA